MADRTTLPILNLGGKTLNIVSHVIVTPRYLIKGQVKTGGARLTDFLNKVQREFVAVEEVTLRSLDGSEQVMAANAMIRREDVVLAHELLDLAGDPHRKAMTQDHSHSQQASAYLSQPAGWEVFGWIKRGLFEAVHDERFFVVQEPEVRGLEGEADPEWAILTRMPYTTLNVSFVQCLLKL